MKEKNIVGLLALFFGGLGIHRFYLNQIGLAFLYIIFCWTFIPAVIALLEAIYFFGLSQEAFDKAYHKEKTA
jgi:TM2 domain-containing membrane protein YozV